MGNKHFGETTKTSVNLDFWLIVSPGAIGAWNARPSARITAAAPSLARNERAINLKVSLPIALFETPAITASITIENPGLPVNIDARAIAEAVRGIVGMDIDLRVSESSQEEPSA